MYIKDIIIVQIKVSKNLILQLSHKTLPFQIGFPTRTKSAICGIYFTLYQSCI